MKPQRLLAILAASLLCVSAYGQNGNKWSAAVNLGDMSYFYTVGVGGGRELSRHFSAEANLKLCPWRFLEPGHETSVNRFRITYAVGLRYWPWHVNSGLWVSAKAQQLCAWQDNAFGNYYIGKNDAGLALTIGYSFMISEKWNIEVGAGGWGGCAIVEPMVKQPYRAYAGGNFFIGYNEVILSLVRLF